MKNLFQQNIKNLITIVTVTLFICLIAAGCDNATAPDHISEEQLANESLALDFTKNQAVETTEGFYFLPPLVKKPDFSGTFDSGLSPIVEICETTECTEIHKTYSMTEGEGSEIIRADADDEHYIVNWHTEKTGTQVGQTYRVRVSVAGTELGFANIKMTENGKEARNATTDEAIGLVDGRTLPIKFRVETGIVGTIQVSPPEASVAAGETQPFTATLYDLHGELITGRQISWTSGDIEIATVDSEGLATGISTGEVLIFASSGPAVGSAALTVIEDDNEWLFTTCGASDFDGPDQTDCTEAYEGTLLEESITVTEGIQSWVVPVTGTYRITAIGAQGASATLGYAGGKGAKISGDFVLNSGDIIKIAVGQEGSGQSSNANGGGGGGSFVVTADDSPMLIAGGGGGTRSGTTHNGCDASVSEYGITGSGSSFTSECTVKTTDLEVGGIVSQSTWGSAGAGFNGDGADDADNCGISGQVGGKSWFNGLKGGNAPTVGNGGFGGGGAGAGCFGGGGGGGYSGGDGGRIAGGGGSFNSGTNQDNVAGVGVGNGSVLIERI